MDIFQKNRRLGFLVLILVLLNLACVAYLVLQGKKPQDKAPGTRDFNKVAATLRKELSLSQDQESALKELRAEFFLKETRLSELIRSQRDSMNVSMFHQTADSLQILAMARRVAENEYQMELLRIEQAVRFRAVCTPEQLAKFEKLVVEIRDYFQPDSDLKK